MYMNVEVVILDQIEQDNSKDDNLQSFRYLRPTMRRSLGVREAEPPRRLRQSQEFQGVGFLLLLVVVVKDINHGDLRVTRLISSRGAQI